MVSSGAAIMGRPDDPSDGKRKGKLRLKLFLLPDEPSRRRKKKKRKITSDKLFETFSKRKETFS
jgi:hypothetical protein